MGVTMLILYMILLLIPQGRIFRSPLMPDLSPVERKSIFESMVSVLANLHELDLKQLKLEDSLDFAKGDHLKQRVKIVCLHFKYENLHSPNLLKRNVYEYVWCYISVEAGQGKFKID